MLQHQALNILKLGLNVFLTGAAGSGKTYLLNSYIRYLRSHQVSVAITASTGIAATHIGGQTIHSWSGFGIKQHIDELELESIVSNDRIKRNLRRAQVLIIDEISMLHAFQLDLVDRILRKARDITLPFGGIQVVVCGDFFQLPPVTRNSYSTNEHPDDLQDNSRHFAYESHAWQNGGFHVCYLHEQHRQGSDALLKVLNDIRSGQANETTKVPLRTRYKQPALSASGSALQATRLYARNVNVDTINNQELAKLPGQASVFEMTSSGFPLFVDGLKRNCLAPEKLQLKLGAQVMFVKNSPERLFVNGTRATVEDFEAGSGLPVVKTFDGLRIVARPEEWRFEENGIVRASITQVPLRLAWAITIHKSQGMTLDAIEVDLTDAFEPGMGYVALSRVRTLNGLKLLGLNQLALEVHPKISQQDHLFQELSEQSCHELDQTSEDHLIKQQNSVLCDRFYGQLEVVDVSAFALPQHRNRSSTAKTKEAKKLSHQITRELVEQAITLQEIANQRSLKLGSIVDHLEKLKGLGQLPDLEYTRSIIPDAEFDQVLNEFKNSQDGKLTPVFEKFDGKYSFDVLRVVRLFAG